MHVVRYSLFVMGTLGYLACATFAFANDAPTPKSQLFQWESTTPESQGMSTARLDSLREMLVRRRTSAFRVIRNDKIVYEWYAPDNDAHKPTGTASLAKAIVGGLSLAAATTDGMISLDDSATKYVSAWKDNPVKSKIKVRHLGSHSSGIADASSAGIKHEELTAWMGDFWKRLDPPNDPFSIARDEAPMLFEPGEKLKYSNTGIAMLTYCVAASMRGTAHSDIRLLLRDHVMRPIGVPDNEWSIGYGKAFQVDGLPLIGAWGGGNFSADAVTRIGRLVLRQGDWDGQRVLSAEAVRQMTTDAGMPGHCGMGWWTNGGRYPELPQDAVWGAGAGDRVLLVIPSLQLIVYRTGTNLLTPSELEELKPKDVMEEFHDPRERIFFRPLMGTIKAAD